MQPKARQNQIDAHDAQIDALIAIDEVRSQQIGELVTAIAQQRTVVADLAKQWQAYINTLPRQ